MTEQKNVQLIQELYAAFGRGDVPAILDQLTDDVVWYDPGPPEVPHAGRYSGREGVGRFFARTDETLEIDEFAPTEFLAQGIASSFSAPYTRESRRRAVHTTTSGRWSGRCATAGWQAGRSMRTPLASLRPTARSRSGLAVPGAWTACVSKRALT